MNHACSRSHDAVQGDDIKFRPATRSPMSEAQRDEVIEALAAILFDYWTYENCGDLDVTTQE